MLHKPPRHEPLLQSAALFTEVPPPGNGLPGLQTPQAITHQHLCLNKPNIPPCFADTLARSGLQNPPLAMANK